MNITAPKTNYFARPITAEHNLITRITEAYTAYGLTPPSRAPEIRKTVEAGAQSTQVVADKLARDAFLSDGDTAEWYADALEQIKEAQAREALANAFSEGYSRNIKAFANQLVRPAAEDLKTPVGKVIKKLVDAAQKLPQGAEALDVEANLSNDSGSALQTVRESLAVLSVVTGIYNSMSGMQQTDNQKLREITPVAKLPTAVVEVISEINDLNPKAANEEQLEGTRTIRKIGQDIRDKGTDLVHILIAQGHYDGARIEFADVDEFNARLQNLGNAHKRTHAR